MLLNLVGNAIKFTDQGAVSIKASAADGIVYGRRLRYRARNFRRPSVKIFEEFEQADSPRPARQGRNGARPAIAKRIIELHDGRIWVELVLGEGATFSFTVPVNVERQARQRMTKRILVIEDQEDNRRILRDLLSSVGLRADRSRKWRGRRCGRRRGSARSDPDGYSAAASGRLRGDTPDQGSIRHSPQSPSSR